MLQPAIPYIRMIAHFRRCYCCQFVDNKKKCCANGTKPNNPMPSCRAQKMHLCIYIAARAFVYIFVMECILVPWAGSMDARRNTFGKLCFRFTPTSDSTALRIIIRKYSERSTIFAIDRHHSRSHISSGGIDVSLSRTHLISPLFDN